MSIVNSKIDILSQPETLVKLQDCRGTLLSYVDPLIVPSLPLAVKSNTVLPLPTSKFQ